MRRTRVKVFSQTSTTNINNEIDSWIDSDRAIEIVRVETNISQPDPNYSALIVVTITYTTH